MPSTSSQADVRRVLARAATPGRPLRVVASGNAAAPWALLRELDAATRGQDVELFMLNAPLGIPDHAGIVPVTPFAGPGMRRHPATRYLPARLSHVPRLLSTTFVPDLVLVTTSAPWKGRASLGMEVNILPAAIESCRAHGGSVLAEEHDDVPYTFGDGELVLDQLDVLWRPPCAEGEVANDLPRAANAPGTQRSPVSGDPIEAIGRRIADRVPSGATLQMGIGAVPDAVVPRLAGRRALAIWTEMVSDGVLHLADAGALDPSRPVVTSFAIGGARLRGWLDRNHGVRMLRTEVVNDPTRIAANPAMTSINSALTVDLYDQANASHLGSRLHSGLGGQCDFVTGAMQSSGGQSLIALRSWHPKADASAIVPLLEGPVTSFQHTAVVTEQGTAEMFGADSAQQARALIDQAARPRVRHELWDEAEAMGLAAR
ncbi:acetyl-CoA hydrolase/transferase family protein [Pedococcus sp. 2YAF34]|uniref:acetyl-CoA hydrolase/transferase family protein n=1 Tax=Pedococcus sp. 2YAF34 TaxID=3233032 RepID=UPI003F980A8D